MVALLWILAGCSPAPPVNVATTNVVLVVGCTVRRDQVGAYGGPQGVTPFLDRLAGQGTVFADLLAAAPWTRAAGTAIHTGQHALSVGMVEPGPDLNERRLPEAVDTLAERFAAGGYRTVGGTSNPNLNRVFGFGQGFQAYVEPEHTWKQDRAKWSADAFVPALLEQVPVAGEQPLFLAATLVDAHAPFHGEAAPWRTFLEPGLPAEVARYRYALHGLDQGIEALYTGLAAKGYTPDNTLFVVVSDHGEGLSWPEHHGRSHGRYLYASAVQAVWMATGPGIPVQRLPGVVSQIDIAPTLLGWAGLPPLGSEGVDLAGWMRTGTGGRAGPVFTDTWFREENRVASWTDAQVCMLELGAAPHEAPTGRFVQGCYDRASDPLQLAPLPIDPAPLLAWREAHPLLEGERAPEATLRDQLGALGYIDPE